MSHWDFGRQADARDQAPPPGPADTEYQQDLVLGADDPWAAPDPRQAGEAWPAGPGWPGDGAARGPWPPGDGWDGEEDGDTVPYPVTYEREHLPEVPEAAPPGPWDPWPPAPGPGADGTATLERDAGLPAGGPAEGRQPDNWRAGFAALGRPDAPGPGHPSEQASPPGEAGDGWAGDGWAGRGWAGGGRHAGPGGRRPLLLAGVIVAGAAVGAAAVLLASGKPGPQPPPGSAARGSQPAAPAAGAGRGPASASGPGTAPLTMAQAQAVLAGYTAANNAANARRSGTQLATVETGSSYAIDAGLYRLQQATAPYPAFGPASATYYIPRGEPAAGPRWFVAQVANSFSSAPKKVTSHEYLLFTQAAPGGPWQDAAEPYLLTGASAPQVAVGADGLATALGPGTASLAVPPGQLPAATAASLDGTGAGGGNGSTAGQAAVGSPGNLADVGDQRFWRGKLPGGTVTDAHAPATGTAGQEFALKTAGGGALVFYTDAAQLTISPPPGATLHLTIPGFYSPARGLPRAGVTYLEQFAAYDPPAGGSAPGVVADYSGITGKD